jgi:hypothetical protein
VLFERFLQTISSLVGDPLAGREADLARLNPNKFYLENVRAVLGVSARRAQMICETAVRQGFFRRGVEVLCPDGVAAATAEREDLLPPVVRCWLDQDGDLEEVELSTDSLRKQTFYRLNDDATPGSLRETA